MKLSFSPPFLPSPPPVSSSLLSRGCVNFHQAIDHLRMLMNLFRLCEASAVSPTLSGWYGELFAKMQQAKKEDAQVLTYHDEQSRGGSGRGEEAFSFSHLEESFLDALLLVLSASDESTGRLFMQDVCTFLKTSRPRFSSSYLRLLRHLVLSLSSSREYPGALLEGIRSSVKVMAEDAIVRTSDIQRDEEQEEAAALLSSLISSGWNFRALVGFERYLAGKSLLFSSPPLLFSASISSSSLPPQRSFLASSFVCFPSS